MVRLKSVEYEAAPVCGESLRTGELPSRRMTNTASAMNARRLMSRQVRKKTPELLF